MSNRRSDTLIVLAAILGAKPAVGQVGHPPERSPYRDLPTRQALVLQGGYLFGSGGSAGAGPHEGPLAGLRYTLHLGGPFEVIFGVAGASLQRVLHVDSLPADTTRQSVAIGEVGFGFLITGAKTWRGLAPYVALTTGAAFGGSVPEDSSGFQFQRRFQFGPQVGVRWYSSRQLSVRLEGRDILWRLAYPNTFFEPTAYPGSLPPLIRGIHPSREWTHNLSVTFALGYALRL
jgi:hypothetical protein